MEPTNTPATHTHTAKPDHRRTQPCRLCGQLMYENGDGWDCGEPCSPAGFYSAHWACVHENPKAGRYGVPPDGIIRWYTTRKRAQEVADDLARWNPGYTFPVITR